MRERIVRLDHDGVQADVRVRVSSRARHARLLVHPDGSPEVVLPERLRRRDPDRLVTANAAWLARHVRLRRERCLATPPLVLDRDGHLPLAGGWLPVSHVGAASGRARIARSGDEVIVAGPVDGPAREAVLERWYRSQAREAVAGLVDGEGARLGLRASRIAIRDQRTRWASCSRTGTLSFCWRLVLAPPEVLRYVVVHELCHLAEANHGPGFWALVERGLPGWQAQRAWLAMHGDALQTWRPALPPDIRGAAVRVS